MRQVRENFSINCKGFIMNIHALKAIEFKYQQYDNTKEKNFNEKYVLYSEIITKYVFNKISYLYYIISYFT